MVKKKDNGTAQEPERDPTLEAQAAQVESILGNIHATRAVTEARKSEPIRKVQDELLAALEPKRAGVEAVSKKWAPYILKAKQVASLDRSDFPYTDAAETAYCAATRAAKEFLSAVAGGQVVDIERNIALLHSEAQIRGGFHEFIMTCIQSLAGLEKRGAEAWAGVVYGVTRLQKYAKEPISTDSAKFPDDPRGLDNPVPHVSKAVNEFDPMASDYGKGR